MQTGRTRHHQQERRFGRYRLAGVQAAPAPTSLSNVWASSRRNTSGRRLQRAVNSRVRDWLWPPSSQPSRPIPAESDKVSGRSDANREGGTRLVASRSRLGISPGDKPQPRQHPCRSPRPHGGASARAWSCRCRGGRRARRRGALLDRSAGRRRGRVACLAPLPRPARYGGICPHPGTNGLTACRPFMTRA